MKHHRGGAADDPEDEADLHDRELPDAADMDPSSDDDDAGGDTEPCPFCGKLIWDNADLCSHCGNFVAFPEQAPRERPIWFWIALVLAFVVICLSALLYRG
jgi:predicted nucleic acid-binding Zn ribbon protein